MPSKILIIDPIHPVFMDEVEKMGYICDYRPEITRREILAVIKEYQGIVVRTKFNVDREIISAGTSLRFIARAGAGMDNIDEEFANTKGIICLNAPEGNRDAVGEHTVGMLLSLLHQINKSHSEIRNGIWDREGNRGVELGGKTVGIIGYGNAGKSFARKLRGFDVRVIAYDKYLIDYGDLYVQAVSMEAIFQEADVLSLHIPLTDETISLINTQFIHRFSKPIYLLNTSRGKIIKTDELIVELENNRLAGAALDVLENEKLSTFTEKEKAWFDYLKKSNKVILTSHVAGWTEESFYKISKVLAAKVKKSFLELNT